LHGLNVDFLIIVCINGREQKYLRHLKYDGTLP
jgi:hypothetical protein